VGELRQFGLDDRDLKERRFEQIIGSSPALESVLGQVERVAPTDSTVLILGETGTRKELIAKAGVSSWPTRERFFSTRSAIFPWLCNRNSCKSCRNRSSSNWAAAGHTR
jgi:transcriptional regulator of aromatic amino acid metabolism